MAASTATCASMVSAGQLSVEGRVVTEAISGAIVDVAAVEWEVGQLIAASEYQTYCTEFAVAGDCRWQTSGDANVDLGAYAEASRHDAASDDWLLGHSTYPWACDDALRLVDFDHDGANSLGSLTASSACAAIGLTASADLYVSVAAQIELQPLGAGQMAQVEAGMQRFVPLSRLAER